MGAGCNAVAIAETIGQVREAGESDGIRDLTDAVPAARQQGPGFTQAEVRRGDGVRLTASVGIAIDTPGESFDRWFARADEALYRAKQAARDRVV
jgi:GGDEF domain-containing protein